MQLQPSHEALNDWYPPHGIEDSQLFLQIEGPVKNRLLWFVLLRGVHPQREIVGEGEVHALLEDGRDVEQDLCFFVSDDFLLLRVVEEVDGFGDFEDIPLAYATDDAHLIS